MLMPAFDDDWRTVLLLWGAVAAVAMLSWLVLATFAGPRTPGFLRSDGAAMPAGLPVIRRILRLSAVRVVLVMGAGAFLSNHGFSNWLPDLLRHGGMSAAAACNSAAARSSGSTCSLSSTSRPRSCTPPSGTWHGPRR